MEESKQNSHSAQKQVFHMLAESHDHWPVPSTSLPVVNAPTLPVPDHILQCTACPLAHTRSNVVFYQQHWEQSKPIWFVIDYPHPQDEAPPEPSEGSSYGLLLKLAQNLGITEKVYYTFSVKCAPIVGIPAESRSLCQNNLKLEKNNQNPKLIACFGASAYESAKATFSADSSRILSFACVLELQQFPKWRKPVFDSLKSNLQLLRKEL